ncbi:ABC transporter substrate-binding protein [Bradyrhizobium viridifuturi]|jgi:branched-chain amino acid transport system substrate-binding protein|uniref:ABC transporter substrate-binding protein n=1 Tax=Bradyrhizobium TaxID=374 RepID=UPI000BDC043A|nr:MULTISPECIES: ABC transporter substrate-binding protein [Bradyrhizobium]OYU59313.1 MAG: branched-chain amino acid ABC transporter substrate-binding protein [Bradyrhizobium sp. PARBB1]PSO17564.1 branched-chain amino acid ABC transporter substrate-binding protein [Bradyrhizobium sp. MOS004]QRI73504.1 ABC transporter substrate-binding protein [Bradyrhizobium sp. PSBB068]MBR1024439.1 ABC transporter substrate-binding protein [Bradyrhizobium viridifuturi]MBR1041446.1 ABC transporter substrate-bi
MMHHHRLSYANCVKSAVLAGLLTIAVASAANAQKKYDPGATDTEIKVGNIMPYSGPASAYATIGKTEAAYFNKLNSEGGINGRKVNFISYDDAYSPPKMVEQARKLVESDEVLLIFNPLGTPGNTAIQKYMNAKKVPQLFVSTGAAKWNDPKNFPWTMGWQPSYQVEARIYAKYILQKYPGKTIGVLYQNDDFGKDYLIGLHDGLGDQAKKLIIVESSYETSSPTVDSQIVQIKGANPDIFVNIATPKFAAQAIKKAAELDWHPVHFLTNVSVSIGGVMKPAGYEASQDILSTQYLKDPADHEWKSDPAMNEWRAFMTKWYPEGDQNDASTVFGYGVAKGLEQVLRQCGDNLTRENLMKQAASLNFEIGIYLPGTRIKTGPDDYAPIEQLQMMRFKGESWERFGPIMSGEKSS